MNSQRTSGSKLALLWVIVAVAFAVALRRSAIVPWGTGAGPGAIGAPLWSLAPLIAVLLLTVGITASWLRQRIRQ